MTIHRVAHQQRRYLLSFQLLTSNREAGRLLPVPENVTLLVESGRFASFLQIPIDAVCRGLLFCVSETTAERLERRSRSRDEIADLINFFTSTRQIPISARSQCGAGPEVERQERRRNR